MGRGEFAAVEDGVFERGADRGFVGDDEAEAAVEEGAFKDVVFEEGQRRAGEELEEGGAFVAGVEGVGEDVGVAFHADAITEVDGCEGDEAVVEKGAFEFSGGEGRLGGADFGGGLFSPVGAVFVDEAGLVVGGPAADVTFGDVVFSWHEEEGGVGEGGFGEGLEFGLELGGAFFVAVEEEDPVGGGLVGGEFALLGVAEPGLVEGAVLWGGVGAEDV